VLITRGSSDVQDFEREVVQALPGEYGKLQKPTPWEAQAAVRRLKERERKRGHDAAARDAAALRNYEAVEVSQRMQVCLRAS
jgi:hypothetical protein